jgi:hypothetical protein
VTYVVGEFYWRVAVGERCVVDDYICPPLMLSREVTAKEASWSQAEYLKPADLCAAFGSRRRRPSAAASMPTSRTRWSRPIAVPAACSGSWRWRRPCVQLAFTFFVRFASCAQAADRSLAAER